MKKIVFVFAILLTFTSCIEAKKETNVAAKAEFSIIIHGGAGTILKKNMTPEFKPYYAVVFTSTQTKNICGYSKMADLMETLAKQQEGFLGVDSPRNEIGITVSYWESLEAIKNWKQNSDHIMAQQKGRQDWYSWYNVRICKVEREYEFTTL